MKNKPTMLMILDGFGVNNNSYGNAIAKANTPNIHKIFNKYPNTVIGASGLDVGLPDGQMGNSEVGHLNIGAGRIVYQELTRITKAIDEKTFFENSILTEGADFAQKNNSALHIFGLLSDGGVHSHIDHLKALILLAKNRGLTKVYLHCFLDGRDVPPRCAIDYISQIEDYMKSVGVGKIATISGRYYSMDRDQRWDRVKLAYDAIALGVGPTAATATLAIENSYANNQNDEFVLPTVIDSKGTVNDNDSIIMFNFRPDRGREITRTFVDKTFDGFKREKVPSNINYVTMTNYDSTLPNVKVAYPPQVLSNTLGEYVSNLGLKQLRIAETEKYAHVTFFFNGGVEEANPLEDRELIPSPKVATYDLQPEMSAFAVTDKLVEVADKYDLIILNFANADMVGHTGIMDAAVKAIEALDVCVEKVVNKVLSLDGQILLTADHGNADVMLDEDSNVITAHSLNKVPLVHIANEPKELLEGGKLADLAPTLLDLMNIDIPAEMTGKSLIK
ncbi:MAG: 2,3-bisphosphoglycerate-independent phosphoglycerate mutase [Anaerovoracaceae bacterium]